MSETLDSAAHTLAELAAEIDSIDLSHIKPWDQFALMDEPAAKAWRQAQERTLSLGKLINELSLKVDHSSTYDGERLFTCPIGNTDAYIDPEKGEVWCECGDQSHTGDDVEWALRYQAEALPRKCSERGSEYGHLQTCLTHKRWIKASDQVADVITKKFAPADVGGQQKVTCGFGHTHMEPRCGLCQKLADEARKGSRRPEATEKWGRVDLNALPETLPPSVGQVSAEVFLFTRGRRYVVYGEAETGKTQLGVITCCQEIAKGKAVIILNGEMAAEDLRDWVMMNSPNPADVEEGLLIYPSSGLLDLEKRGQILADLAASGRELTARPEESLGCGLDT